MRRLKSRCWPGNGIGPGEESLLASCLNGEGARKLKDTQVQITKDSTLGKKGSEDIGHVSDRFPLHVSYLYFLHVFIYSLFKFFHFKHLLSASIYTMHHFKHLRI